MNQILRVTLVLSALALLAGCGTRPGERVGGGAAAGAGTGAVVGAIAGPPGAAVGAAVGAAAGGVDRRRHFAEPSQSRQAAGPEYRERG